MGILRPPKGKIANLEASLPEIDLKSELSSNKSKILPARIAETVKATRNLIFKSKLLRAESERRIDATIALIESCCHD